MKGSGNPSPVQQTPDRAAIEQELDRIAKSPNFLKAERCLRLLRYLVDCGVNGRTGELKEYSLGLAVFERPESFDPRTDPVVRLEARRLRLKLAEYYQQNGVDEPVIIDIPKGGYAPRFQLRPTAPPQPPPPATPKLSRRLSIAAAAATLSLCLSAWYLLPQRGPKPVIRASVAVLGFRDLSGRAETSWMDPAFSELLGIELAAGQQLRTVPAQSIAQMRRDLSLQPDSAYPAPVLQRVGANLGSDYAVAGTYHPDGDRVHLQAMLFDLRSGRQLAAIEDETNAGKLVDLAQRCAQRLRAQLGVRAESGPGAAYPPEDPAAMESYARGMERLRQSDALGARPHLERAAAAAPANPLVHAGLAAAWSMLGLDNRALEEAKLAFDLSAGLGRVEQLEIEGRYREIGNALPRAIRIYQALFTLLPDDLEYGLLLANVQARGGRAQDALATVAVLHHLPPPVRDDPRIDMAESRSAGALTDYAHTRRAAHAAAEKARQRGARLQYARARLLESGAMQNLDIAGYADVRAEARGICAELGDRACVAAALRIEANVLAAIGTPTQARPLYAEVLKIANEIGNQLEKYNALQGIAYTESTQGDLRSAEADYRAALAVGTEMAPDKRYAVALELAEVVAGEGRAEESRALAEEALNYFREAGSRESAAAGRAIVGRALALEGKFADSITAYNEAILSLREVGAPGTLGLALLDFGDVQLDRGDLSAARRNYQEAGDIDRQHHSFAQADVELALARLALAAGQPEDAAVRARTAMEMDTAAGRDGDRLRGTAILARALVARGNVEEASGVLAQAPSPNGKAFPIQAVVEFRIARCLAANGGRGSEECRALNALAAEVSRLGLRPLENEVRVAREAVTKTASASPHR